jgi:hypothetical protein
MQRGLIILVVSIIAVVAGGGLPFAGYQASSTIITVTSTHSFQTATTLASGSVTISSVTTQVTNQNDAYSHNYSLDSPGSEYCGLYDGKYMTLDLGVVVISFSTKGNDPVDFWMLNSQ